MLRGARRWRRALRRLGDGAVVEADDGPAIPGSNRDLRDAEPPRRVASLIPTALRQRADGHREVVVGADADVLPDERLVPQVARAARAEVLRFVERESEGTDAQEVVREQLL